MLTAIGVILTFVTILVVGWSPPQPKDEAVNGTKTNGTTAKTPPQNPATTGKFAHTGIITTVFWVGEEADASNGHIPNAASAWDGDWMSHYGGIDAPDKRNGYLPAGFTPKENPFYFALPYNDIDAHGKRRADAEKYLPVTFKTKSAYSWSKNSWIAIRYGDKVAYAQWQDVGPFEENDAAYVFGTAQPKNRNGESAGLDVSPAVQTYLGLNGLNKTDWSFVSADAVPDGPWKSVVTTSPGYKID